MAKCGNFYTLQNMDLPTKRAIIRKMDVGDLGMQLATMTEDNATNRMSMGHLLATVSGRYKNVLAQN